MSSLEDVWRVKCMEDGFQKMEASSWKENYVKGLRLIERIRSGQAFSIKTLRMNMFAGEGISELFISNEYLFANYRVSSMCDYETKRLVCGHNSGHISMWAWECDGTVEKTAHFVGHIGPVACVAVSKDVGLIASGGTDRVVKLWCLENKQLLFNHARYSSIIRKVILMPTFNPDAVKKGKFVLLVRSKNLIQLFQWSLKTSNVCSSCKHGILEEMLDDTASIVIEDYFKNFFPDQCCFNQGKLFYVRNPLLSEMAVYDLNSKRESGTIYMADKYPFVLAAGGKFALVMQEAVSYDYGFSLLNITKKSEVVKWLLPVIRFDRHTILRVAVPNTSWLDGISYRVPGQLMLAFTDSLEQINVVFWNVHSTPG